MEALIDNRVYQFIGTTDEVTSCDCCGRDNLKMTIVLQEKDGGEFTFFGSQCGAKALGWTVKDVNKTAKNAKHERHQAYMKALNSHPLQQVINNEINQVNAITPRLPYELRRPHMARWAEMRGRIYSEVDAQFAIKKGK